MNTRNWRGAVCATLMSAGILPAQAADIVVGVPNWPSVAATASILKVVLEDNFGLEVELQNATNPVIFEAMDSGSMHVHPEVWLPNQANLHEKFVTSRGTVRMSPNGVPAFQGICVTAATADRTGITQVADLADPDMAKNFDTDGDGWGEVWIGASGWASTNVEKIRAKSYGYDETMELLEMDEALAMANVDAAVAKDANHVFYCYTPNHLFALHDIVVLEEPAYDPVQVERHPTHRRSAMAREVGCSRCLGSGLPARALCCESRGIASRGRRNAGKCQTDDRPGLGNDICPGGREGRSQRLRGAVGERERRTGGFMDELSSRMLARRSYSAGVRRANGPGQRRTLGRSRPVS